MGLMVPIVATAPSLAIQAMEGALLEAASVESGVEDTTFAALERVIGTAANIWNSHTVNQSLADLPVLGVVVLDGRQVAPYRVPRVVDVVSALAVAGVVGAALYRATDQ